MRRCVPSHPVSHDDRLRHSWHWFYSFLRICARRSALFICVSSVAVFFERCLLNLYPSTRKPSLPAVAHQATFRFPVAFFTRRFFHFAHRLQTKQLPLIFTSFGAVHPSFHHVQISQASRSFMSSSAIRRFTPSSLFARSIAEILLAS